MVYRLDHSEKNEDCDEIECKALTAYVRIDGKFTKIGYFGSECKKFKLLDAQQEQEDFELKLRVKQIQNEISKFRNRNYRLNE